MGEAQFYSGAPPGYAFGVRQQPATNIFSPGPVTSKTSVPYGDLAEALNAFMQQQAQAPFDYLKDLVGQRVKTTDEQLHGQVPGDVIAQLMQQGAQGGAGRGFAPGSPNTNSAFLRALGLTSIGQQEAGSKNLSQMIADTPVSPLFNPSSLFVPERLGMLGLGAAQAGLNRQPGNYSGGGGYSAPTPSRWGNAAGATGWGGSTGGTPSPGVGARGQLTDEDIFNRGFTNEGPFPQGYSPFGEDTPNQGPADFSDWWDDPYGD